MYEIKIAQKGFFKTLKVEKYKCETKMSRNFFLSSMWN